MRINRQERIGGLDILRVRDAIRAQGREPFDAQDLASSLKVGESKARKVIEELKARGWLQTAEDWGRPNHWQTTLAGNAFTAASALKPIPRAKADKLLADFLKRVEDVNARDELTHYVAEVRVFGSYAADAPEVGDLDLAVDLRQRQIEGRDIVKYTVERAQGTGRRFGGFINMLGYGEMECQRILKARSPYISIHPPSDLKATTSSGKLVYRAPDEPRFGGKRSGA